MTVPFIVIKLPPLFSFINGGGGASDNESSGTIDLDDLDGLDGLDGLDDVCARLLFLAAASANFICFCIKSFL